MVQISEIASHNDKTHLKANTISRLYTDLQSIPPRSTFVMCMSKRIFCVCTEVAIYMYTSYIKCK